jgi:type I restriction-modification system DNA methylase subunit
MTKEQLKQLEKDLWAAADNLRANSDLKSSEYSTPVLGLIFLKFADNNYRRHEAEIMAEYQELKGTRREKKLSDIAKRQSKRIINFVSRICAAQAVNRCWQDQVKATFESALSRERRDVSEGIQT